MPSTSVIRSPRPGSLYDVLDLVLDKGLVIDAYVRVSVVGIELLTVDARIVVAGVDTYLRFAEAADRLDVPAADKSPGLPELIGDLAEAGVEKGTETIVRQKMARAGGSLASLLPSRGDGGAGRHD